MSDTLTPDICVIGGGAGGCATAIAAASSGASVILIEREKPGGGAVGCSLSLHALLTSATQARTIRQGFMRAGILGSEPGVDFRKVARHMRDAAAAGAVDRSAERLGGLGIMVLRESGRFADARTVAAGEYRIRANHFVIATGSAHVPPDISGLDTVEPLTPETLSSLTRRPGKLLVAGSGPHALAYAQAFRQLGSEVALISPGAVLDGEDPEHTALALEALGAEGVTVRQRARPLEVARRGRAGIRMRLRDLHGEEETLDATHLLVVPTYAPAVDGLEADKAGIVLSRNGIAVDAAMRTSNRRVFAIGDVTGKGGSLTFAEQHAEQVVDTLLRRARRPATAPLPSPRAVFTSPQIAAVGLGEVEARQAHRDIRILRWPIAQGDMSRAGHASTGFVKLVATVDGRILGVSIVAEDAAGMIDVWALAIAKGIGVADMAQRPVIHPSNAEIGKRAAMSYFAHKARKDGWRRFVPFLR